MLDSSFLSESVYGGGQPGYGEYLSLSLELMIWLDWPISKTPGFFCPLPPHWFLCEC